MDAFIDAMYSTFDVIMRTAWIALIALQGMIMSTMFLGVVMMITQFLGGSLNDVVGLVIWAVSSIGSVSLCFAAYYD